MTAQESFAAWLATQEALLAGFIATIQKWIEMNKDFKLTPGPSTDAPHEFKVGEPVTLTLQPISNEELSQLQHGLATAAVKERAMAFVKGFLMAVAIGAGPFGGPLVGTAEIALPAAGAAGAAGCASCGGAV